jgi:hypothetical protein
MSDEDKRIFIDEDWKAQVQREREEAAKKAPGATPEGGDAQPQEDVEGQQGELPATPFLGLVQMLTTQGLFALGAIAPPDTQQVQVDLGGAQMIIEILDDLKKKTEGNLSEEESTNLNQVVNELQRIYVMRAQQVQEQSMRGAGIDPNNLKGEPPQ